jgi:integrase
LPRGAVPTWNPARARGGSRKEHVMPSAWVYQDDKQVKKHGEERASWYVGWIDPEGKRRCKSCGPGPEGKRNAEKLRKRREAELLTGTYQSNTRKTWEEFRREYGERVLAGLAVATRLQAEISLGNFERLVKPVRVSVLTTRHVDEFIAARRQERGRRPGDIISPASVNKDLRHVKAALSVAVEWGYLKQLPRFRMEKAPKKLPRYVPGDHFALIYRVGCEAARMPEGMAYAPADWWRALMVTGYMTGWRIGDMLNLRRDDLDLDAGTAVIRWEAEGNKGKRDELVKLHPVVVEHLKRLPGFTPTVFPWNHNGRTLYDEFARVQQAAGISLPCHRKHEHTPACHVYGFHDLRRAFATYNADKLTPDALQALMRHKSYQTTQLYINMARQMDAAVANLHVPEVLRRESV